MLSKVFEEENIKSVLCVVSGGLCVWNTDDFSGFLRQAFLTLWFNIAFINTFKVCSCKDIFGSYVVYAFLTY